MRKKYLLVMLLLGLLTAWILWANVALEVNEWSIACDSLPESFEGFRIAQVSDLHNTKHWRATVKALEEEKPDIIVLTGDLIDSRRTDVESALEFARQAAKIAPCYYVSGNHESRVAQWPALKRGLLDLGVTVLEDEKILLERAGSTITLMGLRDPDFGGDQASVLGQLTAGQMGFTVLLSHRPERLRLYARYGVDLVFSGHAHGGQVRIPFAGGLAAPHQGFFPQYDSGLYELDGTAMLVSRGVGNSFIPLRINNRPEILVAVLRR